MFHVLSFIIFSCTHPSVFIFFSFVLYKKSKNMFYLLFCCFWFFFFFLGMTPRNNLPMVANKCTTTGIGKAKATPQRVRNWLLMRSKRVPRSKAPLISLKDWEKKWIKFGFMLNKCGTYMMNRWILEVSILKKFLAWKVLKTFPQYYQASQRENLGCVH